MSKVILRNYTVSFNGFEVIKEYTWNESKDKSNYEASFIVFPSPLLPTTWYNIGLLVTDKAFKMVTRQAVMNVICCHDTSGNKIR